MTAYIDDGLGTTMTWGSSTTFTLEKMSITPPAIEGGDKIDITTLNRTAWRTFVPKTLKQLEDAGFTARWDASEHIDAPINSNEAITITFPDGDKIVFWGYLKTLEVGEIVEGDKVEGTGTITVTNWNGSAETAPTYSAAP